MLKNQTVFITGASSGIGAASAHAFAKAGAKLILCARRMEKLQEIKRHVEQHFQTHVHLIQLDITHYQAVKEAIHSLPEAWKKIDVLLNNAGLAAGLDFIQNGNVQDWEDMINTNVKGLLYVTREILPRMVEENSGHIINISSISGHDVYPKGAVYCATKHAVRALSKGLRMDVFGTPIRVSSVDPGAVETNFSLVRFKGDEARASSVYTGMKALTSDDVADAILYCATRPPHVNIGEIILTPTDQVSVTMVNRKEK